MEPYVQSRQAKTARLLALLIVGIFLFSTITTGDVAAKNVQHVGSNNIIAYPSFESPHSIIDSLTCHLRVWCADVFDEGNYGSTITIDNSLDHTGSRSARLDVSDNSTSAQSGIPTTLAQITLFQYLPFNTLFGNLADQSNGFSLWFYIQPKFAGYSIFEIRMHALSGSEMDYVFVNPSIAQSLGFLNSTTGSDSARPIKMFILSPPVGTWVELVRNLRRDWQAPLKLPDGTYAQGFALNDTLVRLDINAFFFKALDGAVHAETVWVDDVSVRMS